MSQIDFGCIFDGFTMNLRFGIGEKSRGRVEPLFSPVGDRDIFIIRRGLFAKFYLCGGDCRIV